ncbi:alpha/beta hydrolase [Aestuariicoccus sp. MJ-SS9]|uniref:alpha/beta hydrolase n=1 Tax=Aestuariicoccus sp. MJ-SS9 TaxID=3079855 RepID=UPI00290DB514|nr:alpha/beta hydrolase [Aestuariicoccus sp. MJ-SS9]MDU8912355.1 alpha/beta hydrolase [Aestuariicoccus sp. MJ-SS9]
MPLLRITVHDDQPLCHDGEMPVAALLSHAHRVAAPGPVVIMVHGYRYAPGRPGRCPHALVQSLSPPPDRPRAISWPRHLGFGRAGTDAGIAISLGWSADGPIWRAWTTAEAAGRALTCLLKDLRHFAPGRDVHVFAHSMGARVALAALRQAAPGDVRTAILMAPAEFSTAAGAALDAPAGRAAGVLHVSSRENAVFDRVLELLIRPPRGGGGAMGRQPLERANLAHLRLDHPPSLAALRRAGYPVAAPDRRICHWSPYLRAGVFPLYRALQSGTLDIARLRALLTKEPAPPHLLSFAPKPAHWPARNPQRARA